MTMDLDEAPEALKAGSETARADRWIPGLACLLLLITYGISVLWSHHKLLEQDEIFSFQTDSVKTLGEVLRIQKYYPISLEPPPYHILSHGAMAVFGGTAFALRLPSLAGFLTMEVALYFFVRNIAGGRAGLVAMAIPVLSWTLFFAVQGRPYGLMLGGYAVVALCWQIASRRADSGSSKSRLWPLVMLSVALAITLNAHFYGVLLLIALCGAETVRTAVRHTLDVWMAVAIAAGTASLATAIPYVRASGEFKKHYYIAQISVHMLTQPYRQMIMDYTTYPKHVQSWLVLALVLAGAATVWGCVRAIRRGTAKAAHAEWAMILLLLMMPVFAFALGRFVTHALEARHSIGAIVGFSTLVAVAVAPALRRDGVFYGVMAGMLLCIAGVNLTRVRQAEAASRETMAALTLAPGLRAEVDANPDRNIYIQDLGEWETASSYEPDANLRSRLVLVYSRDEEMNRRQHDTMYLTAVHTKRFSSLPIMSYDELRKVPGEHIFAAFHSGWSWTDPAFADEASQVSQMGSAFGGDLVKVRFR